MNLADAIKTRLDASAPLAAVLTGGVWTRSIKPSGKGATPEAFSDSGAVKPCAVVKDRGEAADGAGPLGAYAGFPQIWLYAPATSSGRTAVDQAFEIIAPMFLQAEVDGRGVTIAGRLGVDDDPELANAVVDMIRLQADGVWL